MAELTVRTLEAAGPGSTFRVMPDGEVTPSDLDAPEVWHDSDSRYGCRIDSCSTPWEPLGSYTQQYSYHGVDMHPSEGPSKAMVDDLLYLASDGPIDVAMCVVEVLPTDDDPEPEPCGWTILFRESVS